MKKKKTSTKKIKIIMTPTTKIEDAVECHNSEDACKIFKQMLNYENYELRSQGLAAT